MEAFGSGLGAFVFLFLIVAAIAAIFVPFWVFRIRNEMIEANRKLAKLINLAQERESE